MDKLDKRKVLAVVLIIALIAATVGACALLYNSIDMLTNTTYYERGSVYQNYSYQLSDEFTDFQKPMGILMLVAAIVGFLGIAVGVTSFIAKKPALKIALLIIGIVVAITLLTIVVIAACKWKAFYIEKYDYKINKLPNYISSSNTYYVLFTGVMSALIPQFVYFAIIAAVLLTAFIIDIKAKHATVAANDINSENKGE